MGKRELLRLFHLDAGFSIDITLVRGLIVFGCIEGCMFR